MTLIEGLSLGNTKGDYSLIMSQNGSNKISMLRAIAGMWCFGKGTNRFHIKHKNKESNKSTLPEVVNHIQRLKSCCDLEVTVNDKA